MRYNVRYGNIKSIMRSYGIFFTPDGGDRFSDESIVSFNEATSLESCCGILSGSHLGRIGYMSYSWSPIPEFVSVGRYCSIAGGLLVPGGRHPIESLSSSSFMYDKNFSIVRYAEERFGARCPQVSNPQKVKIKIENDVWIGEGVTIARGVTVGTGSVIASRSMVTKSVLPYTIVGGNPAKLIRMRFDDCICNELLKSEWWLANPKDLSKYNLSSPEIFLQEIGDSKFDKLWSPYVMKFEDLLKLL